jgi:hypothetical protein
LTNAACAKLQPFQKANTRGCLEAAKIYKDLGTDDDLVNSRRLANCACASKIQSACDMLKTLR